MRQTRKQDTSAAIPGFLPAIRVDIVAGPKPEKTKKNVRLGVRTWISKNSYCFRAISFADFGWFSLPVR